MTRLFLTDDEKERLDNAWSNIMCGGRMRFAGLEDRELLIIEINKRLGIDCKNYYVNDMELIKKTLYRRLKLRLFHTL